VRRAERVGAIVEELASTGSVSVAQLAASLGASPATIRRDLELLEEQRMLTRTHGGAVGQGVLYELPLRYKSGRHQAEKRRIAHAAAARVSDGTAIGLTGGTTTTEVARSLVDRGTFTVVTNALNIAGELAIRPTVKLVVTGGHARPESYELVGPLAEQALGGLNLDVVFVGADGVSVEAGLTTHHEVEAHTNLALIERSARVIAVADSSKIGRIAFAKICGLERIHELITDDGAEPDALLGIRDAGVEVTTV
jgi:DeoR family transcriptional regulator, aga operon transcriptional repressor